MPTAVGRGGLMLKSHGLRLPLAPLCKGSWQKPQVFDWGVILPQCIFP